MSELIGTGIASLYQLSGKGPEDETIYDVKNASMFQIDKHKRHTPFVINNIHDTIELKQRKINKYKIKTEYGDLLSDIYIHINENRIKNVSLYINSNRIYYKDHIYFKAIKETNNIDDFLKVKLFHKDNDRQFLPIGYMKKTEIFMNIELLDDINEPDEIVCDTYIDYVILDIDEKLQYRYMKTKMIIDYIQLIDIYNIERDIQLIQLNLRHTITQLLILIVKDDEFKQIKDIDLTLNNITIKTPSNEMYFRNIQQYLRNMTYFDGYVYTYSFALYPKSCQLSGGINFSEIQGETELKVTSNDIIGAKVYVYATTINELNIHNDFSSIKYI